MRTVVAPAADPESVCAAVAVVQVPHGELELPMAQPVELLDRVAQALGAHPPTALTPSAATHKRHHTHGCTAGHRSTSPSLSRSAF
ncbi:hypothetical protein [Streptomyces virginiae]|uniref:hypothetical protein n=1 Tax=Streptomyces virginiae TaxID=1961 RepID=UPI0034447076